ncbi:MAG: histidinol-phosphate transaminase [Syntrophomonadaceae bacterium]|nr:histidinol-phosphate transaminase [Syntrophomonadaceae bacterium]MDD3023106.1 histidinol-phosphate transaminase [Syntrophomonadaceae bacterium]
MDDFVNKRARQAIFSLKPYVPGKPIDEVKRELGLNDIIKLASNENPLGPSPMAMQAMEQSIKDIHLYPDANSYYLKARLASFTGIDAQSIVLGNGSDEVLMILGLSFLSPGDEVIYADPTFVEYEFTAMVMGANCVTVSLKEYKHDLPAILQAITNNTKMIVICNPNNPTGTIVSESELDIFMQSVPEDILVVFDEAYSEYVESPDFCSGTRYLQQGRNVIILHTFSKIFGLAGLRIGYGLTSPGIAGAMKMATYPFNMNSAAQAAALAALDDQEHVARSRSINSSGKKYLYTEFERMGLNYIRTEANFILLDCGKPSDKVFQELLQQGIIVRNCASYGYKTYIRITVGTSEENQRLIRELGKVLEVE